MYEGEYAWFLIECGGRSVEMALHVGVIAAANRGESVRDNRCRDFVCARWRDDCEEKYGDKPPYADYGDLSITEQQTATVEEAAPWLPPSPAGSEWGDLFSLFD